MRCKFDGNSGTSVVIPWDVKSLQPSRSLVAGLSLLKAINTSNQTKLTRILQTFDTRLGLPFADYTKMDLSSAPPVLVNHFPRLLTLSLYLDGQHMILLVPCLMLSTDI
jgi:hypothetical protein